MRRALLAGAAALVPDGAASAIGGSVGDGHCGFSQALTTGEIAGGSITRGAVATLANARTGVAMVSRIADRARALEQGLIGIADRRRVA